MTAPMFKIDTESSIIGVLLKPDDTLAVVSVEVNICNRCNNTHIFFKSETGERLAGLMLGALSADALSTALDKAILGLIAQAQSAAGETKQ